MTWEDLKAFAIGELGWTKERWDGATFPEYNMAIEGYWRNWERFYMLPMREICYVNIMGNPNIKQGSKPVSVQDFMRLSIDGEKKRADRPTDEDIERAKEFGKRILDGKKI